MKLGYIATKAIGSIASNLWVARQANKELAKSLEEILKVVSFLGLDDHKEEIENLLREYVVHDKDNAGEILERIKELYLERTNDL